jgi:hypothetical protein
MHNQWLLPKIINNLFDTIFLMLILITCTWFPPKKLKPTQWLLKKNNQHWFDPPTMSIHLALVVAKISLLFFKV